MADEREVQARTELRESDVFGDETPAHPHRVGLGLPQGAFELGVVEIHNARRCSAERHGFVSLAYEHGPALGVRMKSDSRYPAAVLGIQFSHGLNQTYRGLTPVDHCNSSWKPDRQRVGVTHSPSVGAQLYRSERSRDSGRCGRYLTSSSRRRKVRSLAKDLRCNIIRWIR
jgi:hypothetical protein